MHHEGERAILSALIAGSREAISECNLEWGVVRHILRGQELLFPPLNQLETRPVRAGRKAHATSTSPRLSSSPVLSSPPSLDRTGRATPLRFIGRATCGRSVLSWSARIRIRCCERSSRPPACTALCCPAQRAAVSSPGPDPTAHGDSRESW